MADTVTTQILENGPRDLIITFTCISDGSGEVGVRKVDAESLVYANNVGGRLFPPRTRLAVQGVSYNVSGMELRLLWEAEDNFCFLTLGRNSFGRYRYRLANAITVPDGLVGATGSILFTTVDASVGDTYTVTLYMLKRVPPSPDVGDDTELIALEDGTGSILLEDDSGYVELESA